MESDVLQRIKKIIKYKKLSVSAFAAKISMAQTTVNNYLLGKRKPSFELIESICSSFEDISMEWLLRGEGDMIKNISENSQNNLKQSISDDRNNIDEIINQKIEEVVMEHLNEMIDTIMKRMNQQIDSQNKHMREVLKIQSDDNVQNFKVLVDAIKEIVKEEDIEKFERKIVPLKAKIG